MRNAMAQIHAGLSRGEQSPSMVARTAMATAGQDSGVYVNWPDWTYFQRKDGP